MTRPFLLLASFAALAFSAHAALPVLDADNGGIDLPPGFRALVIADNLAVGKKVGNSQDRVRFLAIAPNGDVYAKLVRGGILAMRDTDGDGRIDVKEEFAQGSGSGGTAIMFHDGWLYYSTRTGVYRYKYTPGELVPKGQPETIVSDLPAEKDHDAKSFAFDEQGQMIVEVGSPYNVYSNGDRKFGAKGYTPAEVTEFQKTYGGFWKFDPNKLNQKQSDGKHFSTGHRHSLALIWHPVSKNFFMVMMGRDNLNIVDPDHYDELDNAERVSEEMHLLREGINIGWPYTYYDPIKKAHMLAPEYGGDNHKRDTTSGYDNPVVAFPAHWAPLQMSLYTGTQFPEEYRNGTFVAFHGSWNRAPRSQAGYKVAFVPFDEKGMPTGEYRTFADGFSGLEEFTRPGDARYRPCGVTMGPDGSLYIGDTEKGRIWRVIYTGEKTDPNAATKSKLARASVPAAAPSPLDNTPGGKFYLQVCAACHMPDGAGVPAMQPSLTTSKIVTGDAATLVKVILQGPAAVLPADREHYQNVMPPFGALSDADIANVATYVRTRFGNGASAVTAEQVAALRSKTP
jgi:glucose/arabinose dehydrogenase